MSTQAPFSGYPAGARQPLADESLFSISQPGPYFPTPHGARESAFQRQISGVNARWAPGFMPNGGEEYAASHPARYPWGNESVGRQHGEVQYGGAEYADRCDPHQGLRGRHAGMDLLGPDKATFVLPVDDPIPKPQSKQFGHSLFGLGVRTDGPSKDFVGMTTSQHSNNPDEDGVSDPEAMDPYAAGGEYILERRRRAQILKRTRHQRRVNAAAATKARVALAVVRRGGSLHETKSPEDVRKIEKKQRRVSNRDSVERCRKKQKQRLISWERERVDLAGENEKIRILLDDLEARGFVFPKDV